MSSDPFQTIRFLAAFAVLATSQTLLAQFNIGKGEVADLYANYCASCHGKNLEGGQGSSLIDGVWKHGDSDEDIARVIRDGLPDTPMIAYSAALDEKQIRGLVIFLREQMEIIDKDALGKRLQPKDGIFKSKRHSFRLEPIAKGQLIDTGSGILDATLWGFAFLPDSSLLATQRNGILWHFREGQEPSRIEGIPAVWHVGAESGLFDIALHPNYKDNGWIYLSYSENVGVIDDGKPAGMTAVVRGRIEDGRWIDQEYIYQADKRFHNNAIHHFGSRMIFQDDYLYFSVGDRVLIEDSQDLASPVGKIHRVHSDGSIPVDNPFIATTGASTSIWSFGNRNAQGLAIHPQTGELWSTEHGPRGGDELNLIRKGQNYGWPVITYGINYDGKPITHLTEQDGMEQPIHHWTPSIATAGMAFYTGGEFKKWTGDLFVGGMWAEELHRIRIKEGRVVEDEIILKNQGRVRHVVNGPDGSLYLSLTAGDPRVGAIYRIANAK